MDFRQLCVEDLELKLLLEMPREIKGKYRNFLHSHDFFELGYMLKGGCEWGFERVPALMIKEAQGILMAPGQKHVESARSNEAHRISWVGFSISSPEWAGYLEKSLSGRVLQMEIFYDEITRILRALRREQGEAGLHHSERIRLMLVELLILMDRSHNQVKKINRVKGGTSGKHSRVMASAAHYLEMNFTSPMNVAQIARYHSLSQNHFSVLFSEEYKMTPKQYLQQVRFQKALAMLKDQSLQVKEIGMLCGFKDPARFCRWIKTKTGKTPLQYRQSVN